MAYFLGSTLQTNMINGRPTRCKSSGDYVGLVMPPCGDFAANSSNSSKQSPWLSASSSTPLSLHDEISSFMAYMEPTTAEKHMREDLVNRFTKLIVSFKMDATVRPVGSYVTGLYLPTSDIDMVLTFESDYSHFRTHFGTKYDLEKVMHKIRVSGFASKVEDVLRASVPLVRITDRITGIEIDLTCADHHGIAATRAVQKWMKSDTEVIKMLVTVIKMFLSIRKCGTTYTGGINSYVLVWMVVAWVNLEWPKSRQHQPSPSSSSRTVVHDMDSLNALFESLSVKRSEASQATRIKQVSTVNQKPSKTTQSNINFGEILMKFFDFYGNKFDYKGQGIRIEPQPYYSAKTHSYSRYIFTQHYLLQIYDPADGSIDMGDKAYGIKHIQETFKEAHRLLVDRTRSTRLRGAYQGSQSILGELLGGDFTQFEAKRTKLNSRWL
ncbi:Nucleotidyltransferase [Pholiota conissans]|uniref:polynucleotide adenylyltransferase n=1 Tax=Pholiota conissans TaxID=109636 RepID=A0A9P5ZDS3_9AGAR|nr:Nucleotidyltransferase [Pholiota conissans]